MTSAGTSGFLRGVDRTLGILLALGAAGHTMGSLKTYSEQPMVLLWALCASVLIVLLGVINVLRVSRPRDAALAWVCAGGLVCWLVAAIIFGKLVGNVFDFRVIIFAVLSIGLIFFSLRTVAASAPSGVPRTSQV